MKPLGRRAYGSIGHLPNSRLGPGDHSVPDGQADICLRRTRDRDDVVIVQEKLDGSCCSVALVDGQFLALGRAGYLAQSSRFVQHQYFAEWVRRNERMFRHLLRPGERVVGEWMAQAHGTVYDTEHPGWDPFVVFDIMDGDVRLPYAQFVERVNGSGLVMARPIHIGGAFGMDRVLRAIQYSGHGADEVEGVVYRVERKGAVDFLAKWVRPDKVDGKYLPDVSAFCGTEHWHWKPTREAA